VAIDELIQSSYGEAKAHHTKTVLKMRSQRTNYLLSTPAIKEELRQCGIVDMYTIRPLNRVYSPETNPHEYSQPIFSKRQ
jgi:hypothetical protein